MPQIVRVLSCETGRADDEDRGLIDWGEASGSPGLDVCKFDNSGGKSHGSDYKFDSVSCVEASEDCGGRGGVDVVRISDGRICWGDWRSFRVQPVPDELRHALEVANRIVLLSQRDDRRPAHDRKLDRPDKQ